MHERSDNASESHLARPLSAVFSSFKRQVAANMIAADQPHAEIANRVSGTTASFWNERSRRGAEGE